METGQGRKAKAAAQGAGLEEKPEINKAAREQEQRGVREGAKARAKKRSAAEANKNKGGLKFERLWRACACCVLRT